MKLLFLGDVAVDQSYPQPDFHFPSQYDLILANLEGAIVAADVLRSFSPLQKLALHNAPEVVDFLQQFGVSAVWLANNHIYDLPLPIVQTVKALNAAQIDSFGVGSTLESANKPFVYRQDEAVLKLFAFGWDVIGCQYVAKNREGVNPLKPDHVLRTIKNLRKTDNYSCVIFIFHWNYELELFPQPAHRQLAHDLIDAGVDAVIGLHPHVVQGAEIYQGKPIVYSLGNWFFPSRQLGSFKLTFPPVASRELALDLTIEGRRVSPRFHWYQFDQTKNRLAYESSESIDGPIVQELTPFSGFSHQSYIQWFRKHRKRRRGLPIYRDYRNTTENWLKDRYVGLRQKLITYLVKSGVKQRLSG